MTRLSQEIIDDIFSEQDWRTVDPCINLQLIITAFNFEDLMQLARKLLRAKWEDDTLKEYATVILVAASEKYQDKWKEDWKNDAYLGLAYKHHLRRYDLAYKCFKRAHDRLNDPPQELLLLITRCAHNPEPTMTFEEEKAYSERALAKGLTAEVALQMRAIAKDEEDDKSAEYWFDMYHKLKAEGKHTPQIIPDVFNP